MGNSKQPVIFVDDNPVIADGLNKYFNTVGFAAESFYSAATFKERLTAIKPLAVVLDIKLDDGNGIDLINEVKASWPGVPVIMLTAQGYEESLMLSAKEHGAQGYVSKSVPPEQLLATVLGIIEHPEHHS